LRIKEVLFLFISFGFIKFLEDVKIARYAKFVSKFVTFGRVKVPANMPQSVRFRKTYRIIRSNIYKGWAISSNKTPFIA